MFMQMIYLPFFQSQEEETEQKHEEKVGGPSVLPPASGGGERTASKQTDAVKNWTSTLSL